MLSSVLKKIYCEVFVDIIDTCTTNSNGNSTRFEILANFLCNTDFKDKIRLYIIRTEI